ncbi:LacI family DNA-binding transcriptional regulator [Paenibacillus sp. GCM10023252]|uniref:LacI family DNA-binding transcriptional regulator n=1 Tax=Paenibacillus sp. GCM10023252 TaxID=3252649 RepID=UPI00361CB5D6
MAKITMQKIADRLGLSKYTVSQALAGRSGVSEATRRVILETAKSMGYQLRTEAPAVSTHTQGSSPARATSAYILIWISLPERNNSSFWQRVLLGVTEECSRQGWDHILLSPYDQQGKTVVIPSYIATERCVGGLIIGSMPLTTITAMVHTQLPLVIVDHDEPFVHLDAVNNDNLEAASLIIERMADSGCRRILFLGCDSFAISFRERWWGCLMAAERLTLRGIHMELQKWEVHYNKEGWTRSLAERLADLGEEDWPDGFIGGNDNIALELLAILRARDVGVPERCRVAGFDNIHAAAMASPPLTTVDLGKEELGARAVEALARRIAFPDKPRERITLSPRLVIRESC